MNAMSNFMDLGLPPWLRVAWLVTWQSTIILGLVLILSRLVPMRASRAHRLHLIGVLASLLIPLGSHIVQRLDLGLFAPRPVPASGIDPPAPLGVNASVSAPAPRDQSNEPIRILERPLLERPPETIVAKPSPHEVGGSDRRNTPGSLPAFTPRSINNLIYALFFIVVAIISAGLLRLLVSFCLGLRLKSTAMIVRDSDLEVLLTQAVERMGLTALPEVRVSNRIQCPLIWCWARRPTLILPDSVLYERRRWKECATALFCHELAHWKRSDHLSALAVELLNCLVPWQPLGWVVRARMACLAELACDDWVLAHATDVAPPDYAELLLDLTVNRRRQPLVPAAVSDRSALKDRIQHILNEVNPMPRIGRAWNALILGSALTLIAVLSLAQEKETRRGPENRPERATGSKLADHGKPFVVQGVVHDSSGHPINGAEVVLIGAKSPPVSHVAMPHGHPDYGKQISNVIDRGRTDAQGRFTLRSNTPLPPPDHPRNLVLAHRDGFAIASQGVSTLSQSLELSLREAVKITGKLLTPDGEPAVGVKVQFQGYSNGTWEDDRRLPSLQFEGEADQDRGPAFLPNPIQTDQNGQFDFEGVAPSGVFATLRLTHPEFAVEELTVSTSSGYEPTEALKGFSIQPLPTSFKHSMIPAKPVVGRVTDAETHLPLEGMGVEVIPMGRHGGHPIQTRTDRDGRYRVSDREGQNYFVTVFPDPESGYLPSERGGIRWPVGETELHLDFALRRGIPIRGKVVDEETGLPISNAGVIYQPRRGNPNVKPNDDFRNPNLTDASGRFTLLGARGDGVVVVEAPSDQYIRQTVSPVDFGHTSSIHVHGLTRFEIPADGDAPELLVKLKKGFPFQVRAVGPDGSPLDLVQGWCQELKARLIDNWVQPQEFPNGLFQLPGAEPGRTYRIFLTDRKLKLAAVAEIKADPSRNTPVEVKLEPTASIQGRVLDQDGTPIEGAQILPNIQLVDQGNTLSERDEYNYFIKIPYSMFTKESISPSHPAKFEYDRLIPGVRYFICWFTQADGNAWYAVEPLKPGESRKLGDIRSQKKGGKNAN